MIWWVLYWYAIIGMLLHVFMIYRFPDGWSSLSAYPGWTLFIAMPIVILLWPLAVYAGVAAVRSRSN